MSEPNITFKNRIIGHGEQPASEFQFNPLNWRRHPESQEAALRSILSSIGWVTGVVVNERTGNLIDGHGRIEAALKIEPASLIPFTKVDLSPEEEAKILLLFDPIGGMATTDEDAIRELMTIVGVEEDELLAALSSVSPETVELSQEPNLNDPNFNYESQYGVIVTCRDEAHQKEVYDALAASGYEAKVVVV